jgi:uncharacterized protein (DUF983 family)
LRFWRDHSLTIVLSVVGLLFVGVALAVEWPLDRGRWFDVWLGLGQGALTAALLFAFSGWFRERNRPED